MLQSLDPRIGRWELPETWESPSRKKELDQFPTYEVFHQKRENMPFAYVGPVHAPNLEMAFLFAKEQYSRRATCTGLWVVRTQDIQLTPYAGDNESVYQQLTFPEVQAAGEPKKTYEVFHLKKRGKAHTHAGTVQAVSCQEALLQAQAAFGDQVPCVNVWIIPADALIRSGAENRDMWVTTPEKKYREPVAYKVLDKITAFKNQLR